MLLLCLPPLTLPLFPSLRQAERSGVDDEGSGWRPRWRGPREAWQGSVDEAAAAVPLSRRAAVVLLGVWAGLLVFLAAWSAVGAPWAVSLLAPLYRVGSVMWGDEAVALPLLLATPQV